MVSPGGFWDGFARWVLRWFNDVGFVMVSQGGFLWFNEVVFRTD